MTRNAMLRCWSSEISPPTSQNPQCAVGETRGGIPPCAEETAAGSRRSHGCSMRRRRSLCTRGCSLRELATTDLPVDPWCLQEVFAMFWPWPYSNTSPVILPDAFSCIFYTSTVSLWHSSGYSTLLIFWGSFMPVVFSEARLARLCCCPLLKRTFASPAVCREDLTAAQK